MPENYYPDNDSTQKPLLTWRALHGNCMYANWLNYYVYQATPYDMVGTPDFQPDSDRISYTDILKGISESTMFQKRNPLL